MSKGELERAFPHLAHDGYEITSPKAWRYNGIAWAARDVTRKWDCPSMPSPAFHWPKDADRGDEIEALVSVFVVLGYEHCQDGSLEAGFEEVALYADDLNEWTHAARQLSDGRWTSKMGDGEDLTHSTPVGVADSLYGTPYCFMKKARVVSDEKKTESQEDQTNGQGELS